MAEMYMPPWLTRDYEPVQTFLRAYQTGAQISEAQTRLAEQQRQANMDAMAKREALQSNMLRAVTELEVQKEYQQQRMALENAQLEETKRRTDEMAQKAAADVAERQAYHQAAAQEALARIKETTAHNQMMEQLRGREVGAREKDAATRAAAAERKPTYGESALVAEDVKNKIKDLQDLKNQLAGMSPTERTGFLGIGGQVVPRKAYVDLQKQIRDAEMGIRGIDKTKKDTAAIRAEADAAIARGAPRDAVSARFKQLTGEDY